MSLSHPTQLVRLNLKQALKIQMTGSSFGIQHGRDPMVRIAKNGKKVVSVCPPRRGNGQGHDLE